MATVQVQKHVSAPPAAVFERAADFPNAADTVSAITQVEMLTDGPVGVGTRFRETRLMFGREASEEMEVLEFEPPQHYVLGCDSHGTRYRSEVRCTPSGDGTELSMTFEATPLTLVAKILSLVMRPMMRKMTEAICTDLDEIKAAVEGRAEAAEVSAG